MIAGDAFGIIKHGVWRRHSRVGAAYGNSRAVLPYEIGRTFKYKNVRFSKVPLTKQAACL